MKINYQYQNWLIWIYVQFLLGFSFKDNEVRLSLIFAEINVKFKIQGMNIIQDLEYIIIMYNFILKMPSIMFVKPIHVRRNTPCILEIWFSENI